MNSEIRMGNNQQNKQQTTSSSGDLEAIARRFEQAWLLNQTPHIEDYLPTISTDAAKARARQELLYELIKIDFEFRWRVAGEHRFVENYVSRFPELRDIQQIPVDLIAEEYRVRHRWGDQPTHAEILARFPSCETRLLAAVQEIDRELTQEWSDERPLRSHNHESLTRFMFPESCPEIFFDDLVLQKMIGVGGMGKVYRALRKSTDKPVAAKFLKKAYLGIPEAVHRFLQEARVLSHLRHPGIVSLHGLGRTPHGGVFIVMDLIEGRDLAQLIDAGSIEPGDAAQWVRKIADAVENAHANEVIHCDLKPSNILLSEDGRVLVSDFGLARSLSVDQPAFANVAGTSAYMAPEQIDAFWGPVTSKTDVYGLGALLYSLLTRQAPYSGNFVDVLGNVASNILPTPPETIRPELPQSLVDICTKCLSKKPADRFDSAAEVSHALQSFLEKII